MAQIGLDILASGFTGKLIIRWVRASAPLAEVGRSAAFDFPYDDVYVIPDLAPVVYIVQLWRSDDGVSLDQLIKDWSIDASKETRTTVITYQYVTGRGWNNTSPVNTGTQVWADPSDLDVNLVDERLDGFMKSQLLVMEGGYGPHVDADYDLLAGGGITLLNGKTFDEDAAWFITVALSEVVTLPSDSGGNDMFAGVQEITDDVDFDSDLYNKLCPVNAAATNVTVTFPDLTLIPDGTHVTFTTNGGSQNYCTLQFDAGDTVKWLNQDVNVIYLAKGQQIQLYFAGGVCYAINNPSFAQMNRGGVWVEYDTDKDTDTGAYLYADEATGVLDKADYPGLYAYILQLSGTSVCPLGTGVGQWSYSNAGVYENKRKFGIDTGAETFRVPHLSGVTAKMSATPGVYEADNVGAFSGTLSITHGYSYTGSPNSTVSGNGATNPQAQNVPFSYTPVITENRVKSYSQKPYIIL
jgi:hypothetical protein